MIKYENIQVLHDTINKLYNKRIILINDREFKEADDITNEIVGLRDKLNVLEREWIENVKDNVRLSEAGNNRVNRLKDEKRMDLAELVSDYM